VNKIIRRVVWSKEPHTPSAIFHTFCYRSFILTMNGFDWHWIKSKSVRYLYRNNKCRTKRCTVNGSVCTNIAVPRPPCFLAVFFKTTHFDPAFLSVLWFSPPVSPCPGLTNRNWLWVLPSVPYIYIPVFRGQSPLATCLLAALLNYSTTLKMEAIRSSETSGTTQSTTRRHIPEEDTLHDQSCPCYDGTSVS
jgi:hypothetical protein